MRPQGITTLPVIQYVQRKGRENVKRKLPGTSMKHKMLNPRVKQERAGGGHKLRFTKCFIQAEVSLRICQDLMCVTQSQTTEETELCHQIQFQFSQSKFPYTAWLPNTHMTHTTDLSPQQSKVHTSGNALVLLIFMGSRQ